MKNDLETDRNIINTEMPYKPKINTVRKDLPRPGDV